MTWQSHSPVIARDEMMWQSHSPVIARNEVTWQSHKKRLYFSYDFSF
jgi:hypothetical protein